ncbi:MAG TPA: hypothetical protein VM032_05290 [Vicinamibacterales bacterium]|nr:hypothetical protein [Vicinamibacterales bacterium]
MSRTVQSVLALALTVGALLAPGALAAAQSDTLAAAKAAYLATEYEEALTLLAAPQVGPAADQADVYRALCLLALGRMTDVDRVLRSLVLRNPAFRMSAGDVTPRLIAIFEDVRSRTLLAMVKDGYAEAKSSFEAGRFADASSRFRDLLTLISREQAALAKEGAAAQDVRQLAIGFKDLADAEVAKAAAADVAARAAAASASVVRDTARDETLIAGVVERYALAYSALDAGAVAQVFPRENPVILRSAFGRLKSQSITTRDLDIDLAPDRQAATVALTWVVEAVPKIGSTVRAQRPTILRLTKSAAGDWTIVERR